jgi:hypothetical protein
VEEAPGLINRLKNLHTTFQQQAPPLPMAPMVKPHLLEPSLQPVVEREALGTSKPPLDSGLLQGQEDLVVVVLVAPLGQTNSAEPE